MTALYMTYNLRWNGRDRKRCTEFSVHSGTSADLLVRAHPARRQTAVHALPRRADAAKPKVELAQVRARVIVQQFSI